MILKICLVILFTILVFINLFCLWVLAQISSITTDKEEQMEIERKLKK